jgi:cytochrome P450
VRIEALASNFVSETLRLHQSEYFYREVQREIQIGDFRIPAGWLLRVCVRECHDNPAVFAEPHTFRPERFADRHYEKTEYCPFSDGTHSCFGAGLALMIARALVTVLAFDFDGRVVADGPSERDGNRHWSHWRPSKKLRVALSRRAATPAPQERVLQSLAD